MKLSVVITTRNEEANIANCIRAFDAFRDDVEIIVVDNASADDTKAIAASLGAKVLDKGPERCAQRNLGWRTATADWVVILDADMILPPETIREILAVTDPNPTPKTPNLPNTQTPKHPTTRFLAYWIPEVRTGSGLRVKARNFERSFYNGTCIDGLRLFRKDVLTSVGGYDESIYACEDWDLDIRVQNGNWACGILEHALIHNEKALTFKRMLEKKAYYTKSFATYQEKWKGHPAVKKQFSPFYRFFGVFVENGKWKKLFRHPILACVMFVDRFAVGVVYLVNRGR